MFTSRESIEIFHLLFLDQLGRKVSKDHYALKGGCNLRFFLKSIRYSQDMDLDIQTVRKETLANAVNRILDSIPFGLLLQAKQIELVNVTEPKQTETTQRWKIQIKMASSPSPLHTKIEFSRRRKEEQALFELVDSNITSSYQLTPIYASHYSLEAAFIQKLWALILRTETQARDLFDLSHLLSSGVKIEQLPSDMNREQAQENAFSISYEAYKSQVVSYLPLDYQQQYSDPALWEAMVLRLVDFLIKCD
jgi:predicted nucleotidyltransferase component of viral defense system